MLSEVIDHIRNRTYMSGVERDRARVKATGEVFTPTPLVQEILDRLDPSLFQDPTKTFLDPTCGDGQFLGEVLIRKIENGHPFETGTPINLRCRSYAGQCGSMQRTTACAAVRILDT
jgi:hypothetical protein